MNEISKTRPLRLSLRLQDPCAALLEDRVATEGGPLATRAAEIITDALIRARQDDSCTVGAGLAPIAGKYPRCRPFAWPTAAVVLLIVTTATAAVAIFSYCSVRRSSGHAAVAWSDERMELEAENDLLMSVYDRTLADLRGSKAATVALEAKLRSLEASPRNRRQPNCQPPTAGDRSINQDAPANCQGKARRERQG
jgi:hypothetical protein